MQAEITKRGNGFIITPQYIDSYSKKLPQIAADTKPLSLNTVKEALSTSTLACTAYAKASGKKLFFKVLSTAVAFCCILVFFCCFSFSTGIYCNGEKIAAGHSKEEFLSALKKAQATALKYGISDLKLNFSTSPVLSLKSDILSANALHDKILASSGHFVMGYALYSDGALVFNTATRETAQEVLNEYISSCSMNGNATLSSKVECKPALIFKSNLSDKKECLAILQENKSINVVSVVNSTSSKVIPFEVQQEHDSALYVGESVTVVEGVNGNAQVSLETVYENGTEQSSHVTSEKIIANPVASVVRVGTKYKKVLESGLNYPLKGVLSSPFGSRWGSVHEGIDIAVAEGTQVKAAECGTVSYVSENAGGYGKLVRINHGYGVETAYAHLSQINVSVGQNVSKDTVIALSGNTGRSTGPHLHFEILENGNPVDPLKHLPKAS